MKFFTLITCALLTISASAFAFLDQKHQQICETEEVKAMMGMTGSCQAVVVPQKLANKTGMCAGSFRSIQCTVHYAIIPEGAAMILSCGSFRQELSANAISYRVAAVVKMENGKQMLVDDNREYFNLTSNFVKMKFADEAGLVKDPSVALMIGVGTELTNVICI